MDNWDLAYELARKWSAGEKDGVVEECRSNIPLLTKVLVLVGYDEKQELMDKWCGRR